MIDLPMSVPYLVSMRGVSKIYHVGAQAVGALHHVNIDIAAGEKIAITGPSGSGKSSLMHLLGILDTPSNGRYFFDGIDCSSLGSEDKSTIRNERIGFIFQQFHLLQHLSMYQNIELPLLYAGLEKPVREARIKTSLSNVGLWHRRDHKPNELSGGEQQRVAIARSLVNLPRLLLADEPTGALDSSNGKLVLQLLLDLCDSQATTLVVVTHDPQVAARFVRQISMQDGMIESDTTQALQNEAVSI